MIFQSAHKEAYSFEGPINVTGDFFNDPVRYEYFEHSDHGEERGESATCCLRFASLYGMPSPAMNAAIAQILTILL